jgi:hypothetical protein
MKKLLIAGAVAVIVSLPAAIGLAGNASFAQSVPVQVPPGARTIDDRGHHVEPRDYRARHAESGDDRRGTRDTGKPNSTRGSDEVKGPGSVTSGDGGSGRGGHDGAAEQ